MGDQSEQSELTREEKSWLLALARRTLENLEPTGAKVPPEEKLLPNEIPPGARGAHGTFVTLHRRGELRGCIGYIVSADPLYRTVIENTVNAARRDPRFAPVEKDEVGEMDIEISVMTVPREISDPSEIEVGRHGLIVSKRGAKGLLLPQVATQYGWNRETFLEHTCQKAGLAPDAWRKQSARIEVFSAQVFSEKTI